RQWRHPAYFAHPGEGSTNVPVSATAVEEPLTPQQFVRLPASAATGPQILVWAEGLGRVSDHEAFGQALEGADLRSAGGPVPVRTTNGASRAPGPQSIAPLPGDGAGVVVPPAPLQPGVAYRLCTRWRTLDGRRFGHVMAFATRNADGTPGPAPSTGFQDPAL